MVDLFQGHTASSDRTLCSLSARGALLPHVQGTERGRDGLLTAVHITRHSITITNRNDWNRNRGDRKEGEQRDRGREEGWREI